MGGANSGSLKHYKSIILCNIQKWLQIHDDSQHNQFLRNATVATRDPTDPPKVNVGYVPTCPRYWNVGNSLCVSLGDSVSAEELTLLWLKFSTSCTSSSFVLLQEVITYSSKQWHVSPKLDCSFTKECNVYAPV